MKVSGFSFIRNALVNDYPVKEAIISVLPLCDEFCLALGQGSDGTEEYVRLIASDKLKIISSVWDEGLRRGGEVFAAETNKAFDAVDPSSDWAFYIQADECVHEKYLPVIQKAMFDYLNDDRVDGLLFKYLHFYGSYDFVGTSRKWYRKEIRVIRNDKAIRSYKDAQGFRKAGKKLNVKEVDAWIYHYGWAKPGPGLIWKMQNFGTFYNGPKAPSPSTGEFDYSNGDRLARFEGSHPSVMRDRIASGAVRLPEGFNNAVAKLSLRRRALQLVEDITGYRIGEYKNYRVI